jgi:hypothetical protein
MERLHDYVAVLLDTDRSDRLRAEAAQDRLARAVTGRVERSPRRRRAPARVIPLQRRPTGTLDEPTTHRKAS